MIILICKDGATQVPREVKDLEEAQTLATNLGFPVLVQGDDGSKVPLEEVARWQAHIEMERIVQASREPSEPGGAAQQTEVPKGIVAKVKAAVTRKKK